MKSPLPRSSYGNTVGGNNSRRKVFIPDTRKEEVKMGKE